MGYLALYRKYRPDNFDDVVGQDEIVKIIGTEIKNNKISHAYLFSGPRGTGKTTTAKIIAKMVNCTNMIDGKPCGKCESCLNNTNSDIVEIDAASNNGVDEIRELRNKINLVPSNSKYKIYIIDEVHMLTIQAFNALLKTLEEPPGHAIFILATTELHKIPLTVSSRCQKFQFSKIDSKEIVKRLQKICDLEKINVDVNILEEVARLSDGGLRDAINLLDQLVSYNPNDINIDDLYKISSIVSNKELFELFSYISLNDNSNIINLIAKFNNSGKNLSKIVEEMMILLKNVMLYNNLNEFSDNSLIVDLSKKYNTDFIYIIINTLNDLLNKLKYSSYPEILFQITLIKLSNDLFGNKIELYNMDNTINVNKNDKETESNINKPAENIILPDSKSICKISDEIKQIRIINAFATADKKLKNDFLKNYSTVNNYLVNSEYNVSAGLLNDVSVEVVGKNNIIFSANNESIASRMNELSDNVSELLFLIYRIRYYVITLTNDEWLMEKNKYVNDKNKDINYCYKEEISKISNDDITIKKSSTDKLIELVGEEMIEYK